MTVDVLCVNANANANVFTLEFSAQLCGYRVDLFSLDWFIICCKHQFPSKCIVDNNKPTPWTSVIRLTYRLISASWTLILLYYRVYFLFLAAADTTHSYSHSARVTFCVFRPGWISLSHSGIPAWICAGRAAESHQHHRHHGYSFLLRSLLVR